MNYIDELYKTTPEYQRTYEEGFNDGRDFAVSEMLTTIRKVAKAEAFKITSATAEITN